MRLPDTDDMREESARMLVKFEDAGVDPRWSR